jgi:hypothetical protein
MKFLDAGSQGRRIEVGNKMKKLQTEKLKMEIEEFGLEFAKMLS